MLLRDFDGSPTKSRAPDSQVSENSDCRAMLYLW